jgi:putative hydrolase of HD superfamily
MIPEPTMPTRRIVEVVVVVSVIAAPCRWWIGRGYLPVGNNGQDADVDELAATLAFFLEIDKLKGVERRNRLADGSRRENTAEHSWHLGMAVALLAPFAGEPVDLARAITMALVHDIVEIDAGDTFAYDVGEAAASKAAREEAAADRLFGMLPPATGGQLRAMWEEYERGDTPEARLVMAVDRLAPVMLNLAEGGTTWREHGIDADRVVARNGRYIAAALPAAWEHVRVALEAAAADGRLPPSPAVHDAFTAREVDRADGSVPSTS